MKKIFSAIVMALLVMGCSSTKEMSIVGTWHINDANGVSTEKGEEEAFIVFSAANEINGSTSVNSFFGKYKYASENLSLSDMGMTKRMGASMDVEDAVVQGLNSVKQCKISGNEATFFDESGKEIMHLVKKSE